MSRGPLRGSRRRNSRLTDRGGGVLDLHPAAPYTFAPAVIGSEAAMDVELLEVRDFLAGLHPFDRLPDAVLDALPGAIRSRYARRGAVVLETGQACEFLHVLRTGAVETHAPDGTLLARLSEGEVFGARALLADGRARNRVEAIEDSLLYLLPARSFLDLVRDHVQFAYFFAPLGAGRLRDATAVAQADRDDLGRMAVRVRDLVARAPVTVESSASLREAARAMRDNQVSCLLVMDRGRLAGILTDRDLRNRVVADAVDVAAPVTAVMTADPIALDDDAMVFDALLTMTRHNIHHLPVQRGGETVGVVTNTDLMRLQRTSAVYLVGDIHKQNDGAGLAAVVARAPRLLAELVDAGGSAANIGRVLTSVSDAVTARLLTLAERALGPPPVPYLWLAAGSQARNEQTGLSDQDNCLILDDAYAEPEHGAYFEALARFVNDGLNTAGYVYCPGEMMACTPKWRRPLAAWKEYFRAWIETPEPMALMLSCIFFDLRPVAGDFRLFAALDGMIRERARGNRIFIAHMVGNALKHTPPLGFFRNFVLSRGGEHDRRFDLKHNGVVPIVDIARIRALEGGIAAVGTWDRLLAARAAGGLSEEGARDLMDAYEFIALTRLKHQATQIRAGGAPDNFVAPEDLSHFERSHLKDAFLVVKTFQAALASEYQPR